MTAVQTHAQHRERLKRFGPEGQRLAYVDEGPRDGQPVVLLHGMPTSSWLYRHIIPGLAAQGLRVIAPDMLGFGASDKPADASAYAFDAQAERLVRLMQSLGIARWTQVVHDLGGPWTWELADRHPETLKGLVVMNTTAYREGFHPPAMIRMAGGPMGRFMAWLMQHPMTGPGQIRSLLRQLTVHHHRITPDVVQGHWTPLSEGTTHAFLAFARVFPWWFDQFERYAAALRRLDVPAATIWGRHDAVLDVNTLPALFARDLRIPPERMHAVDAGHFLQEDQPEDVTRLLIQFMRSVP